jgi:hypothetical protein
LFSSSPSSKVIKTVGRKTFFAWDEDTVTSILHAQEIDDDGEEDIRVVSLCPFAALSVVVVVSKLESLEVERVQIPLDTIYYEWERAGVVTASEQSLVVMVSRVRVQLLVKV